MTDLIYKTEEAKFAAVVDDITERHEKGQPVLIGTTSVERSEYLSRQLGSAVSRIRCSTPVSRAGSADRGRGRHARRGHRRHQHGRPRYRRRARGNPDIIADMRLRKAGLDPVTTPEEYEAAWDEAIAVARDNAAEQARPCARPAACTCWAPNATNHGVSTTSCVAAPAVRATRASPVSTSRSATS